MTLMENYSDENEKISVFDVDFNFDARAGG